MRQIITLLYARSPIKVPACQVTEPHFDIFQIVSFCSWTLVVFLSKHYLTFFSTHLGLFNLFPSFSKLPKPRLQWVKRSKGRGAHHKNIFVFLMSNQNFQVFSCLIFKTRLKVKSRFRYDFDLTVTHLLKCNRNLNEVNAMSNV